LEFSFIKRRKICFLNFWKKIIYKKQLSIIMLINIFNFYKKLNIYIRTKFVSIFKSKPYYFRLYKSYWHLYKKNYNCSTIHLNYYAAIPNPGAGIGHQMANWIAGYWFAKQFNLIFAHVPFSNNIWDSFLGFGDNEKNVVELISEGYKLVRLPLFDEFKESDIILQKKIISTYSNKKVIFIAEQDQGYKDQYGVIDSINQKFYSSSIRKFDLLFYDKNNFNIAIHIRRGDIILGKQNLIPNILLRWQDNQYFINVLNNILEIINTNKPIFIYIFSQGIESDYIDFLKFKNINFCLDLNEQSTFLHMVFADVLITSKSSFSYKSALLNRGLKVCPKEFWHSYPNNNDWILVDEKGFLIINNKYA